jgi:hypothetical protein
MLVNDDYATAQDETHILHPSSRKLFRFWETMRAEKAAPGRDELDLKKIRELVPNLFIAEYAPRSGLYRWRLAGTAICELFRRELTGNNMLADWDSFEADTISRFLASTIASRQPCILRFRLQTDRAQIIGAELAGFPMISADAKSTQIFGGLFTFREITTLDYTTLTRFEISAARSIWTENLPAAAQPPQADAPALRNFHLISGGLSHR